MPTQLEVLTGDPNVIVSLITSALSSKGACVVNHYRVPPIGTDDHLGYSQPTRLLIMPNHVRRMLNAMVDIFTMLSTNSALACGMRKHDRDATLELVLCSQIPINRTTIRRIARTWDLMASISRLSNSMSAAQEEKEYACLLLDCDTISSLLPQIRHAFDQELIELIKWSDLQKSWLAEVELHQHDISNWKECPSMFENVAEKVARCCELISEISPWSPDLNGPSLENWNYLRKQLKETQRALRAPLKGENNFHNFEWQVCARTNMLRPVFERLTRVLKNLFTLREYASSTSTASRVIFGCALKITPLQCLRPEYDISWPSSIRTWEGLRDAVHSDHNFAFIGSPSIHNHSLLPSSSSHLSVHPELTVVTHLNEMSLHDDGTSYPYNYVAISGLACKACSLWIRAYNNLNPDAGFAIQGSNNKWHPHWGMPKLQQESQVLRKEIIKVGLNIYFHFMTKYNHSKTLEPPPADFSEEHDRVIKRRHIIESADY